ncbi:MAG: DUF262 domain-containing protein [Dysgonomonas sp.]
MDTKNSIYDLRFNLNYYGADYPVDSLVYRMQKEEFIIPNFQRQYVWKIEEASKFIESLLLGLPVPSLFLARDKYSNKLIVIDGQQRLKTLLYFFEGKFPDGKLFRLKNVSFEFLNKTYAELTAEDRINLDNIIIHCIIIAENDNTDRMFYLFERLNTTGTPLTNQEIRNAIYHGNFNYSLGVFSSSETWKALYHKEDLRLNDQELILRFLAFHFNLEDYSGDLVQFLNDFMRDNRTLGDRISRNDIESIFYETFRVIEHSIGNYAFYHNKIFNKGLFDTVALTVSKNIHNIKDESQVKYFYEQIIKNEDFWLLNKSATTSKGSILRKLDLANYIFLNR